MPNDLPTKDPRNIWKNQTTEAFKMSVEELRGKSQQLQRKARIETVYSIIIGLIFFVLFARNFATNHEVVSRMGWGLLSLWSMYFAYQAYKWIWPGRLAPDPRVNTTLQSYRSELEKRRDYAPNIWHRAGLSFCFLGVAMVMVPLLIRSLDSPRFLANWAPVFVLLAVWLATFFPMRKRRQQRLQQEIEELRTLEAESRS